MASEWDCLRFKVNMKKCYLNVHPATRKCLNKTLKSLWLKIFFHLPWYRWCIWICEYFREFSEKIRKLSSPQNIFKQKWKKDWAGKLNVELKSKWHPGLNENRKIDNLFLQCKNLMLLSAYRLLVDEPGEVGGGVGLPGGAQRLQALSYLILLLDPSDPGLLVRQVWIRQRKF